MEGGDGLQFRKEHTIKLSAYINSWTWRQCLCCFKEYKHLEILNQVMCALINNLVIAQVRVLLDQELCKHYSTINIDSMWQAESNRAEPLNIENECNNRRTERQNAIEEKSNSTRICNMTEQESSMF